MQGRILLRSCPEILEGRNQARNRDLPETHKAHVLHVKEHYARLEADAAAEVASAHGVWKAKYGGQKRLPLDTAGETWTANMPDHVIEDGDFHVKAPAPIEKVIADQAKAEKKAEEAAAPAEAAPAEAAPAFVQLYRSRRNLAQKRVAAESESESESSASTTSSSDSSSSGSD